MFWISDGEIFLFRGVMTLFLCLWLSGDDVSLVVDVFLRGNIVFSTINVGCTLSNDTLCRINIIVFYWFFTGFLLVFIFVFY